MHALLLTTDSQIWHHDFEPDKAAASQMLALINRRQGLNSITLDDTSKLYYGSKLPTLRENHLATTIACTHRAGSHRAGSPAVHGSAVLLTADTEAWIEQILAVQSRRFVPLT